MNEADMNRADGMHNYERDTTTGSVRNSSMDNGLFARELDYQAHMSMPLALLKCTLLAAEEVNKAKILLLQKYRPPIGELLAEAG